MKDSCDLCEEKDNVIVGKDADNNNVCDECYYCMTSGDAEVAE